MRSRSYTLTKLLFSIRNAARMSQYWMKIRQRRWWSVCLAWHYLPIFFSVPNFCILPFFRWYYQLWIISFRMIFFELITNQPNIVRLPVVVVVLCVAFKRAFKIEFYVEISFAIFAVFVCLHFICFDCSHIGFVLRALWWQQRLVYCTDTPTLLSFSLSHSYIIGKQIKCCYI